MNKHKLQKQMVNSEKIIHLIEKIEKADHLNSLADQKQQAVGELQIQPSGRTSLYPSLAK